MRNSRAKAIHLEELEKPEGTTNSLIRKARREYSNGLKRVPSPKPISPVGHPGFPGNTVQNIKTWAEKQPGKVTIQSNVWETAKQGLKKIKRSLKRTSDNKTKIVSRVITTFPKKVKA